MVAEVALTLGHARLLVGNVPASDAAAVACQVHWQSKNCGHRLLWTYGELAEAEAAKAVVMVPRMVLGFEALTTDVA
jgi:hypothetical protein